MQQFKISPLSKAKTRKRDSSWFLLLLIFLQTIISVVYLFRFNDQIDLLQKRVSYLEINTSIGGKNV